MPRGVSLKMKTTQAIRAGHQILELALKDKAKLEKRLEAATLAGLEADVATLENQASDTQVARAQKRAATKGQDEAAGILAGRVQSVRDAVKLRDLPVTVRKAVGIGRRINAKKVSNVRASATLVIEAYGNHADALRSAGILPADIDVLRGEEQALAAADKTQEKKVVSSKLSTSARDAVQRRVETGIYKIEAAAALEFAVSKPERYAQYRAVLPKQTHKRKPKPA